MLNCLNVIGARGFLDSMSYYYNGIIYQHDTILYYEILIIIVIIWALTLCIIKKYPNHFSYKDFTFHQFLEIIWTILPGIILILIGYPSFQLLYLLDDNSAPSITIKVIAHQWYWSYEFNNNSFDAYMIKNLEPDTFRLLDTDYFLTLPSNTFIRFLVTSTDVLHSFAIPQLGIKCDAIPGKINAISLETFKPGYYYGQCSELCGVAHSYMPINIKFI